MSSFFSVTIENSKEMSDCSSCSCSLCLCPLWVLRPLCVEVLKSHRSQSKVKFSCSTTTSADGAVEVVSSATDAVVGVKGIITEASVDDEDLPRSWQPGAGQPAGSFASSPQAHGDEGGERDSLEEQQWAKETVVRPLLVVRLREASPHIDHTVMI